MNDLESVPRSIQRFVYSVLKDPWRVTLVSDPIPVLDSKRPLATIQPIGDAEVLFARRSIPQGDVHRGQTYVVTAYPVVASGERSGGHEARQCAQLLDDAVTYGTTTDAGVHFTMPLTLPLWDYTGVAVEAAGPLNPVAALEVRSHSVRVLTDPEDPRRYTVPLTLQLDWWSQGRVRKDAAADPVAASMGGRFIP